MSSFNPDKQPEILRSIFHSGYNKSVIAGINDDDCGVQQIDSKQIVISTDYLNANPIAVELGIASLFDLGRLLVASNISDLCGSGALPISMLTAITMNKLDHEKDFLQLMDGVRFELDKIKIPLIGGDSKIGKSRSFLGVAIGVKKNDSKLFLRNGAKEGDTIWVSGEIGNVAAALHGYSIPKTSNLEKSWFKWARNAILNPSIPLQKSQGVALQKLGNGGTDLSDGLGSDLWDICTSSKVGAVIQSERLPTSIQTKQLANRNEIPNWFYPLILGGDFQFIVTAESQYFSKMKDLGFYDIGIIIKDSVVYIEHANNSILLPNDLGHEDGRNMNFLEEIDFQIDRLIELIKND